MSVPLLNECKCNICTVDSAVLPGWRSLLDKEFQAEYFSKIKKYLHTTKFYPLPSKILRCLSFFECSDTKVVILGQDPYHGRDQAEGLSFSVPVGVRPPPSLLNIRKEILSSTGIKSACVGGSLTSWARQGVLLLNSTLTVTPEKPRSHASIGWMRFTDEIIQLVSRESTGTVFMLWGKDAQEKRPLIDESKHLVLATSHPSPFSARRGFLGSQHFMLANAYLASKGKKPIIW
ncbi:uracil-DNA glycosylase [Nematocida minor]|uniref:uracil-DNA glycosylase n=1 Tax=Nematocida minor TaxID=1912983 RepID=UPI002220D739|nr:uracil-DNA glycosylase [Nematocida minor]KAI5190232.1 uracil-DNA glycosylase [Nematocida minor]